MAYIGKEPQVGNYVKLDAITTSSTNTYNLTKDSVAFTPESALHMLVSLNGVIQSPLTSFSVSGSTITFLPSSGTLSSSDTIDFILVLGNVLDIGTPSDSTVTNAKTNFASSSSAAGLQIRGDGTTDGTSGTLQLNCSYNTHGIKLASPAHTHGQSYTLTFPTTAPSADKFLKTDSSGNLSFADAGGANTPYFMGKKADSNQVTTRNTLTVLTGFTSDEIDSDSAFDGETFTVPSGKAGKYVFSCQIKHLFNDIGGDGERFYARFRRTSSGVDTSWGLADFEKASGYNINRASSSLTQIIDLAVGDTVKCLAYNKDGNAGGNAKISSDSYFMGFKLIG